MTTPEKSSFLNRQLSKQDAIIQIFRPKLAGQFTMALDVFDRLVSECETLVKLGVVMRTNGQTFHVTPEDLKNNLDEFGEIENLATDGRKLLAELGFVSPRKTMPIFGAAPVGETVDVKPFEFQLPGSASLAGAVVTPKPKNET